MSAVESIYREDCLKAGVVAAYDNLIRKGSSPGFAAMLALQSPPHCTGTERAYLEGDVIHHGLQAMPKFMQEDFIRKARKAGIQTTGKVYKGGLADQRGPACPDAWVSGVDDMYAVARRRNLTISRGGRVIHQGEPQPEPESIPLSPSALKSLAGKYVQENPEWVRKPEELAEMIVEKHGKPARKNGSASNAKKLQKSLEKMEARLNAD